MKTSAHLQNKQNNNPNRSGGRLGLGGDRRQILLGRAAGWTAFTFAKSLQISVSYRCQGPKADGPRLFALFHNRLLVASLLGQPWVEDRPSVVLTSASKDGTVLAASMEPFGFEAVRGSSSRRGAAALVILRKQLKAGKHVSITPDGPKGPCYKVQPGIIKLASLTEVPIIPVHINYMKYWKLNTWDRFQVPHPFSRAEVEFGKEFVVPPALDEKGLEVERKRLEETMQAGLNDLSSNT